MKYLSSALALCALVLLIVAIAVSPSCASDPAKADTIVAKWNEIVADTVITPEEAAEFAAVMREQMGETSEINWPATIAGVAGSVLTSFLGVNAYRNSRERKVWGPPPATGAGPGPSPAPTPA